MIHAFQTPTIVLIDDGGGLPQSTLQTYADAMWRKMDEDLAPFWNVTAKFRVQTPTTQLQVGEWPHYFHDLPTATDPSGALAYHYRLPDGTPAMRTFVGLCTKYGDQPSQTADHENIEAALNEMLNMCFQDSEGVFWAGEGADPCEAVGYQKNGVWMSDFVTREWFSPPDTTLGTIYNFLRTMTAPFTVLPGGYAQKFSGSAGWQMVGEMRPYRRDLHALGLSRSARRNATAKAA